MVWGSVPTGQGSVRKRPGLPSGGQIEGGRQSGDGMGQAKETGRTGVWFEAAGFECERLKGEMILLHRGAGHRAPEVCGMSPASVENCP